MINSQCLRPVLEVELGLDRSMKSGSPGMVNIVWVVSGMFVLLAFAVMKCLQTWRVLVRVHPSFLEVFCNAGSLTRQRIESAVLMSFPLDSKRVCAVWHGRRLRMYNRR